MSKKEPELEWWLAPVSASPAPSSSDKPTSHAASCAVCADPAPSSAAAPAAATAAATNAPAAAAAPKPKPKTVKPQAKSESVADDGSKTLAQVYHDAQRKHRALADLPPDTKQANIQTAFLEFLKVEKMVGAGGQRAT